MFCHNCGKQIPDDSKFCPYCGQVSDNPTPSPSDKYVEVPTKDSRNQGLTVNGRQIMVDDSMHGIRAGLLVAFIVGVCTAIVGFLIQTIVLSIYAKKGPFSRLEKNLLTVGIIVSFLETFLIIFFIPGGQWGFSWNW
jgi:hypothetical protein